MFVGEAPGRNEDLEGRPFVGQAGKILTEMLARIGLSRSQVYITNVVKCRPPANRDPRPEEIQACLPFLMRQIKLIRPEILVALGRHAGRTLYGLAGLKWPGMSRAHGTAKRVVINSVSLLLFTTYHPAAALYKPEIRRVLEEDFARLKELLGGSERGGRTLLDYL
jgi:DNA polymerase